MAVINAQKTSFPTVMGARGARTVVHASRTVIASGDPGQVTQTPNTPQSTKHPNTP